MRECERVSLKEGVCVEGICVASFFPVFRASNGLCCPFWHVSVLLRSRSE